MRFAHRRPQLIWNASVGRARLRSGAMQDDAEGPVSESSRRIRGRRWNRLHVLFAAVLLGGSAILSRSMLSFHAAGPPEAVSPPPPTPPPDCFWSVEAQAWVDTNSNGVWDKRETPLAGVQFRLHEYTAGVSDSRGMATLFIFPVQCSGVEIAVSALSPPRYQPTTKQPLKVRGVGRVGKVLFGFRHAR